MVLKRQAASHFPPARSTCLRGCPSTWHLGSEPFTCSPSVQSGKLCFPGSHLAPVEAPGRQFPNTSTTVLTTVLLFNRSVVSDSAISVGASVAHQAPLSMGFFSQEYWSGLPCPPARGSFQPRDRTRISYVSCFGRWILYARATREACGCRSSGNTW